MASLRSLESLEVTTDQNAVFLYPIVESSLPDYVLQIWQRRPEAGYQSEDNTKEPNSSQRLNNLLKFIKEEIRGAERLEFVRAGFKRPENMQEKEIQKRTSPTAAHLLNQSDNESCVFCDMTSHKSRNCNRVKRMTLEQRRQKATKAKVCFRCLGRRHMARDCRSEFKCFACKGRHVELMCSRRRGEIHEKKSDVKRDNLEAPSTSMANQTCSSEVLLMITSARVESPRGQRKVRILFDSGSQRSYIRKALIGQLNLEKIGSDYFGECLTGRTLKLKSGPTAIETIFGWILCGRPSYQGEGLVTTMITALLNQARIEELWDLEVLGIKDACSDKNRKEHDEREMERDCLRFLWWKTGTNETKGLRHKRVVFGLKCSPFLLAAVLEYHLESIRDERKLVAAKLLKSFYVDNCVTSLKEEEVKDFMEISIQLMTEAKMELNQWAITGVFAQAESDVSVLGLLWDNMEDILKCYVTRPFQIPNGLTKRTVLSCIQRFFDPLGFFSPVLISPKVLLQKTWTLKFEWDAQLPTDIEKEFRSWLYEIASLDQVVIPRCLYLDSEGDVQLHVFCDASCEAYASVVFARSVVQDTVRVVFLWAKARVAPLKRISIPRLELMACVLGARLLNAIRNALGVDYPTYMWSDSSTAITWITRAQTWNTFVKNRVNEIRNLTDVESWAHISGDENPADLPSRGCSATRYLKSEWWKGPHWLYGDPDDWMKTELIVNKEEVNMESKECVLAEVALERRILSTKTVILMRYPVDLNYVMGSERNSQDEEFSSTSLHL
ncbi:hypothetical protein LAZ67_14001067, partial [Cordylochernes scorpioides]